MSRLAQALKKDLDKILEDPRNWTAAAWHLTKDGLDYSNYSNNIRDYDTVQVAKTKPRCLYCQTKVSSTDKHCSSCGAVI